MLTYSIFDNYTDLCAFTTERNGGCSKGHYASLNLSPYSGDTTDCIQRNKLLLCEKLALDLDNLIIPYQTHETVVKCIDPFFFELSNQAQTDYLHGVDALITSMKEVCISVTTADCVPLLFFDPKQMVVAVAHAGWRGTHGRIAANTIAGMQKFYNCKPEHILVTIGPSISPSVYEVGYELRDVFESAGFDCSRIFKQTNEKLFLDLWEANRLILLENNIAASNIQIAGLCTYTHNERFFSARRLGIKSGRILSGIIVRNN